MKYREAPPNGNPVNTATILAEQKLSQSFFYLKYSFNTAVAIPLIWPDFCGPLVTAD